MTITKSNRWIPTIEQRTAIRNAALHEADVGQVVTIMIDAAAAPEDPKQSSINTLLVAPDGAPTLLGAQKKWRTLAYGIPLTEDGRAKVDMSLYGSGWRESTLTVRYAQGRVTEIIGAPESTGARRYCGATGRPLS